MNNIFKPEMDKLKLKAEAIHIKMVSTEDWMLKERYYNELKAINVQYEELYSFTEIHSPPCHKELSHEKDTSN